ncbi:hypothetical protein D3C85_1874750 [compost metagenome]
MTWSPEAVLKSKRALKAVPIRFVAFVMVSVTDSIAVLSICTAEKGIEKRVSK